MLTTGLTLVILKMTSMRFYRSQYFKLMSYMHTYIDADFYLNA